MNTIQPKGIPCPECGARIIVEIGDLLATSKVNCAGCGLELVMDRERSAKSVQELERFQREFSVAEQRMDSAQEGFHVETRSRRRPGRRRRTRGRRNDG